MLQANSNCLLLLIHDTPSALALAFDRAGSNIAARIAIMAITTNNSIKVNPPEASSRLHSRILIRHTILIRFSKGTTRFRAARQSSDNLVELLWSRRVDIDRTRSSSHRTPRSGHCGTGIQRSAATPGNDQSSGGVLHRQLRLGRV